MALDLSGAAGRRTPQGSGDLLGQQQLNMRLRRQHAAYKVALQTRQERRHEHNDRHPDGNAADDEQGLQPAFAQKSQRHDPLKWQPDGQHADVP